MSLGLESAAAQKNQVPAAITDVLLKKYLYYFLLAHASTDCGGHVGAIKIDLLYK